MLQYKNTRTAETDPLRRKSMEKEQCGVCGYVYDPEKGDPDGGIAPGTAFKDIPDNWVCPICGATKDCFTVVNE